MCFFLAAVQATCKCNLFCCQALLQVVQGQECNAHPAATQTLLQGKEEELRKLRTVEETAALSAADGEELAGSFEGDVVLTVDDAQAVTLTPMQVGAACRIHHRPLHLGEQCFIIFPHPSSWYRSICFAGAASASLCRSGK